MHGWMQWIDGWMNGWWLMEWAWKTGIQISVLSGMHGGNPSSAISVDWVRTYSWESLGMNSMDNWPNTDKKRQTRDKTELCQLQHHCIGVWVKSFSWWWNNSCPVNNSCAKCWKISRHAFVAKHPFALPQTYSLGLPSCLATIEAEIERYNGHTLNGTFHSSFFQNGKT